MEFWAHINGKDYPTAIGVPLTENLGEELDTMSINIVHVHDMEIKPYDDIYITDKKEFVGRPYGTIHVPSAYGEKFYKHFLVYDYTRTEVFNAEADNGKIYNFSISLVSETKGIERIALPNRSIFQPLSKMGRTVFELASYFIDDYSPKIKSLIVPFLFNDESSQVKDKWYYYEKYLINFSRDYYTGLKIGPSYAEALTYIHSIGLFTVKEKFGSVEAYETMLDNPNLREILTKLFRISNCIPVVLDDVILVKDLSKRGNHVTEIKGKTWDTQMMSGESYVDRFRKNYSSALTDKNCIKFHEYVGFRNINKATMKFSDLKIELKNPIYRINNFYVCYYSEDAGGKLRKLDLTSFVLPSTTRALLSNDWFDFKATLPSTINGYTDSSGVYHRGVCDYRFMTVEYEIGSNSITGFGDFQKYTEDGLNYAQTCVLENVLKTGIRETIGDERFENGVKTGEDILGGKLTDVIQIVNKSIQLSDILAPNIDSNINTFFSGELHKLFGREDAPLGEQSLKMKGIFFEIEYQGLVSSAVTVSKNDHDGNIMSIDNQHESMALTEQDGLLSKANINRVGNVTSNVSARIYSIDDLYNVNDYDDEHGICYKRVLSFQKDFISANYTFCKDYVIANFFTSVDSKYRSSAYASMSQNSQRDENSCVQMLISKDKQYRGTNARYDYEFFISKKDVFSIFEPKNVLEEDTSMAYYYLKTPKGTQYFVSDRAIYMSGCSLCVTFGMIDSVTAGTYIRQLYPDLSKVTINALNGSNRLFGANSTDYTMFASVDSPVNALTGTLQDYLSLPMSKDDGALEDMWFVYGFGNKETTLDSYFEKDVEHNETSIKTLYDNKLNRMPNISESFFNDNFQSTILKHEQYKDSREVLNETFQIEPVSDTKDIRFSPLLLKMSNMSNQMTRVYKDFDEALDSNPLIVWTDNFKTGQTWSGGGGTEVNGYVFTHSLSIYTIKNDYSLEALKKLIGYEINKQIEFSSVSGINNSSSFLTKPLYITIKSITEVTSDYIKVKMNMSRELSGLYSTFTEFVGNKRIFTSDFEAVFWRTEVIDKERIDNPSLNNYFYPEAGVRENGSYFSVYDSLYLMNNSEKDFLKNSVNRICFTMNIAAFPQDYTYLEDDNGNVKKYVKLNQLYKLAFDGGTDDRISPDSDDIMENSIGPATINCSCLAANQKNKYLVFPTPPKDATWSFHEPNESLSTQFAEELKLSTTKQNMYWFFSPFKMDENQYFDENKSYTESDLAVTYTDEDGKKWRIFVPAYSDKEKYGAISENNGKITFNILINYSDVEKKPSLQKDIQGSLLLFRKDNKTGIFKFVFGLNASGTMKLPFTSPLSITFENNVLYLSTVFDRSKTVYSEYMLPLYERKNYTGETSTDLADNLCVPKESK